MKLTIELPAKMTTEDFAKQLRLAKMKLVVGDGCYRIETVTDLKQLCTKPRCTEAAVVSDLCAKHFLRSI